MPTYTLSLLEWVVGFALRQVSPQDAKKAVAQLFKSIDEGIQDLSKRSDGKPYDGVVDEVAAEVHAACEAIEKALA